MNSLVIASNIIKRVLKEINCLNFLIIFPILAGFLAVIMFSDNVIEIGASNTDKDFGLINYIDGSDKYSIKTYEESELKRKINNKEVNIGLEFSDGFNLNSKDKLKLISINSSTEIEELKGIIDMYYSNYLKGNKLNPNILNNKDNNQGKTAMGMFMMFVIMFVGNEMALLLEDKKLKTFTRAFTAPLKNYEMALGQLIANTLLGSLQILIFLFFTTVIFKVNWGVSIAYMFLILFIFMITAIGFAIGLAGIIKESEKYNMILMLIALVTSFLGGSFFPLENLNKLINKISNFIPQRWVIDAFVKLSEGGTISDIYTNILVLILFGIVLFTFGIKSLKPNLEDL